HNYDAGSNILQVLFGDGGRDRYYEDARASGTPGTYTDGSCTAPNTVAPATFIDGTLALGGSVDQGALFYDYTHNQGGFTAIMTQDEGTDLIYIPGAQRSGWHLQGLLGRPNATVPCGYDNQVSGECRIPSVTATSQKTWGAIKSMYRR